MKRMNWGVSNTVLEKGAIKSTATFFSIFLEVHLLFYMEDKFKREISAGFGYLSDMCQTNINSLKSPWILWCLYLTKHRWPRQLSLPALLLRCPFLAWTSFPKGPYHYFSYDMKCPLQIRQVSVSPELWEHQTRLCPSCPCSPCPGMKMSPTPSVSLLLSHIPLLFYFINPCKRTALSRRLSTFQLFNLWPHHVFSVGSRSHTLWTSCEPDRGSCVSPQFEFKHIWS